MTYQPVTDLSTDQSDRSAQLASFAAAWEERRQELEEHNLEELHTRMRRRWAIDTGMIEGLYTISRGTTELLIERGLHADLISHGESDRPAAEIIGFLHDQAEVFDWLFDFLAKGRPLGTAFIKELHQLLTRHQTTTTAIDTLGNLVEVELLKGEWKRSSNNPQRRDGSVHLYCPPEHVTSEMDRLLTLHHAHSRAGVAPEVEAAWLHHRFTQIHPFQDGNGRVARALATLVLIRARLFPMSVSPDEKATYIDALEQADSGQLDGLINLLVAQQRREFGRALGVAEQMADERQLFDSALAKAKDATGTRVAAYGDVKELAKAVGATAVEDLQQRRNEFNERLRSEALADTYHAHVFCPQDEKGSDWYRTQIIECAHKFDYFAELHEYRDWVRLSIADENADRATVLIVSIHGFGRTFKGVLVALPFIEVVSRNEEGQREAQGPWLATTEPFTFGYLDQRDHVMPRFRDWLHTAWISTLKAWRESL